MTAINRLSRWSLKGNFILCQKRHSNNLSLIKWSIYRSSPVIEMVTTRLRMCACACVCTHVCVCVCACVRVCVNGERQRQGDIRRSRAIQILDR